MRTDCTRDNRKAYLPNASHLGFDLWYAKRGNWLRFNYDGRQLVGRSLGRVHADGTTYLEVIALLGAADIPAVRWIKADDVIQCREAPPREVFDFICGPWDDVAAILKHVNA